MKSFPPSIVSAPRHLLLSPANNLPPFTLSCEHPLFPPPLFYLPHLPITVLLTTYFSFLSLSRSRTPPSADMPPLRKDAVPSFGCIFCSITYSKESKALQHLDSQLPGYCDAHGRPAPHYSPFDSHPIDVIRVFWMPTGHRPGDQIPEYSGRPRAYKNQKMETGILLFTLSVPTLSSLHVKYSTCQVQADSCGRKPWPSSTLTRLVLQSLLESDYKTLMR